MYARIEFTVENHPKALVVPTNAVVMVRGAQGVFMSAGGKTARFQAVKTGIEQGELTEVTEGLQDGDSIIATGAAALQDGDRIVLAGQTAAAPGPAGAGQPTRSGRGAGQGTGQGGGQGRGTGRAGASAGTPQGASSAQRTQ
jgi:hypothetical protein